MLVSSFGFAWRSAALAFRMALWAFPVFVIAAFLSDLVAPHMFAVFGGGFLSGFGPIIFLLLMVASLFVSALAGSFLASLGFSVYHGQSPLQPGFLQHVLGRVLSVAMIFLWLLMFAIPFAFVSFLLMQVLAQFIPFLAMLIVIPGQLVCFVALAICIDSGRTAWQSLSLAWQFFTSNFWWFLIVAILLILVPMILQIVISGSVLFATGGGQSGFKISYYIVHLPIMAFIYSLSAAAGVIAVTEGDWSRTDIRD